MTKLTEKLYGAGLIALAFSLNAADVNAQTCTTAPSCAELGFDKSSSDCSGHSILKCPFDKTKFYCDSGTATATPTPTTPTTPTYEAGDAYYHNGMYLGIVIRVTDKSIVVTSTPYKPSKASCSGASEYCVNLTTGGALWSMPSESDARLIYKYTKKEYIAGGDTGYSTIPCTWCGSSCYSTFSDSGQYACVTAFQNQ